MTTAAAEGLPPQPPTLCSPGCATSHRRCSTVGSRRRRRQVLPTRRWTQTPPGLERNKPARTGRSVSRRLPRHSQCRRQKRTRRRHCRGRQRRLVRVMIMAPRLLSRAYRSWLYCTTYLSITGPDAALVAFPDSRRPAPGSFPGISTSTTPCRRLLPPSGRATTAAPAQPEPGRRPHGRRPTARRGRPPPRPRGRPGRSQPGLPVRPARPCAGDATADILRRAPG